MEVLGTLIQYLGLPIFFIMLAIAMYRGVPERYKIIREIDELGKEKYEVWFKYKSLLTRYPWCLEASFYTLKEAEDFVAGKSINREVVKEGSLL
jgi:hypothetical protein